MEKMTIGEMTKALLFYIKTFQIAGAEIKYDTSGGEMKGIMELPCDQFNVDEFATRLEFFGCGDSHTTPKVCLIDGIGCTIKTIYPLNGNDMLHQLKTLIPSNRTANTDKTLAILRKILRVVDTAATVVPASSAGV